MAPRRFPLKDELLALGWASSRGTCSRLSSSTTHARLCALQRPTLAAHGVGHGTGASQAQATRHRHQQRHRHRVAGAPSTGTAQGQRGRSSQLSDDQTSPRMVVHAPSRRGYDYFETQVFNSTIKDNKEMVCLFNGISGEDTHFHPECLIPTGAKVGDVASKKLG